jgi:hypothetical protein
MGGFGQFMESVNPLHKATFGSGGLDIWGIKAEEDLRESEEASAARRAEEEARLNKKATPTYAPEAEKYSVSAEQEQRANSRRRFLLEQSTGRAPTGPQIQPQQKTLL